MKLNPTVAGLAASALLIPLLTWSAASAARVDTPLRAGPTPLLVTSDFQIGPYDRQVAQQLDKLTATSPNVRAGAAEALAYLRAYSAAGALVRALGDEAATVRREAAMSLAWCGGRREVEPLLAALEDEDWTVAQAAAVSLNNLTGMEWPFDALANSSKTGPEIREKQIAAWRRWWSRVPNDSPAADVFQLAGAEDDDEKRLRGVRALGALGGKGASRAVTNVLVPFKEQSYRELNPLQKHLVQSCIRSLGRLRDPQSLPVLLDFLDTADWARYAADALGDFGDRRAVGPLLALYPRVSRGLNNRSKNPELCPADDRFSGDNTRDRMHETPYAVALTLTRLPLDDPQNADALGNIVVHLLANLPSDWDGGVLYEPESFELITAYLLERAGVRQAVCDAAFEAAARADGWLFSRDWDSVEPGDSIEECLRKLATKMHGDVPYMGPWLPALCRRADVPRLIGLLEQESGWLRINAAKALMFIGDRRAVEPIGRLLNASHPEAAYGFSGALEHAEYDDPTPRWREAFVRALGRFEAKPYERLLVKILEDERNVLEVRYAAAEALDEMDTPGAVAALRRAEADHPFHSVRLVAREALWKRGLRVASRPAVPKIVAAASSSHGEEINSAARWGQPEAIVFIKGDKENGSDFNGQAGVDPWRQTYSITNSGPTFRRGHNLYILRPARPDGKVTRLTHFKDGFVADCEVSWDGKRVLFAHRRNGEDRNYGEVPYDAASLKQPGEPVFGGDDDPWWHIWEINVDGTGLRQITRGPYHDVQPAYLPDDRIIFSSSRLGVRDEYHGYPASGLTVMNADGSDIHTIGFNLGGDREPAVLDDGRIAFARLDNFYSRLKTELMLHVAFPDGTRNFGLYGPERRGYWMDLHKKNAAWSMRDGYRGTRDNRNRVLRLSQPQAFGPGRVIFTSSAGLAITGPGRHQETKIPHDRKWAVCSPFPLDDRRVLCSATIKQFKVDGRIVTAGTEAFERLGKGPGLFRSAINIDLGLYVMDAETGQMTLLYNDPETGDFEGRPIMPRPRPPVRFEKARSRSYTARLVCNSALNSREPRTATRGKLVRVIEGRPVLARHETQNNRPTNRWKNHGGTHARILGTVPLAADGSFHVEVPADRLLHLQVLDSDRRTVNNQTFWLYARPGESRSCIGCHETPDTAQLSNRFPSAAAVPPVKCLPVGGEFSYRAKAWLKGALPDECEERTRTVRAVNLLGRY